MQRDGIILIAAMVAQGLLAPTIPGIAPRLVASIVLAGVLIVCVVDGVVAAARFAKARQAEQAAGYVTTRIGWHDDLWLLDDDGRVVLAPRGPAPAPGTQAWAPAPGPAHAPEDLEDTAVTIFAALELLVADPDERQYVIVGVEGADYLYVQFLAPDEGVISGEVVGEKFLPSGDRGRLNVDALRALGYEREPEGNFGRSWVDSGLVEIANTAAVALHDGLGVPPGTPLRVRDAIDD